MQENKLNMLTGGAKIQILAALFPCYKLVVYQHKSWETGLVGFVTHFFYLNCYFPLWWSLILHHHFLIRVITASCVGSSSSSRAQSASSSSLSVHFFHFSSIHTSPPTGACLTVCLIPITQNSLCPPGSLSLSLSAKNLFPDHITPPSSSSLLLVFLFIHNSGWSVKQAERDCRRQRSQLSSTGKKVRLPWKQNFWIFCGHSTF